MHIELNITRRLVRRAVTVALGLVVAGVAVTACDTTQPSSQQQETNRQQSSYNRLTKAQPAHEMSYSATRATVNAWIDRWGKPGKLSYVYLQNANGDLLGYYVLKGLPVSYCAALTPTYRVEHHDANYGGNVVVPAPGMDGVYYSGAGSCNTYYGLDATTNAYIEYTAGLGINVLLFDQPLPDKNVKPLGWTKVVDGKPVKR